MTSSRKKDTFYKENQFKEQIIALISKLKHWFHLSKIKKRKYEPINILKNNFMIKCSVWRHYSYLQKCQKL